MDEVPSWWPLKWDNEKSTSSANVVELPFNVTVFFVPHLNEYRVFNVGYLQGEGMNALYTEDLLEVFCRLMVLARARGYNGGREAT